MDGLSALKEIVRVFGSEALWDSEHMKVMLAQYEVGESFTEAYLKIIQSDDDWSYNLAHYMVFDKGASWDDYYVKKRINCMVIAIGVSRPIIAGIVYDMSVSCSEYFRKDPDNINGVILTALSPFRTVDIKEVSVFESFLNKDYEKAVNNIPYSDSFDFFNGDECQHQVWISQEYGKLCVEVPLYIVEYEFYHHTEVDPNRFADSVNDMYSLAFEKCYEEDFLSEVSEQLFDLWTESGEDDIGRCDCHFPIDFGYACDYLKAELLVMKDVLSYVDKIIVRLDSSIRDKTMDLGDVGDMLPTYINEAYQSLYEVIKTHLGMLIDMMVGLSENEKTEHFDKLIQASSVILDVIRFLSESRPLSEYELCPNWFEDSVNWPIDYSPISDLEYCNKLDHRVEELLIVGPSNIIYENNINLALKTILTFGPNISK